MVTSEVYLFTSTCGANMLTLKVQSQLQQTTLLNSSLFSGNIRLDISCESSARQKIYMKYIKPDFLRKIKVN